MVPFKATKTSFPCFGAVIRHSRTDPREEAALANTKVGGPWHIAFCLLHLSPPQAWPGFGLSCQCCRMSQTAFLSPRTPRQIQKMSPQHASVRDRKHNVRNRRTAAYLCQPRAEGAQSPSTAGRGQSKPLGQLKMWLV